MKRVVVAAAVAAAMLTSACKKSEAAKAPPPPPGVLVTAAVQHDEPIVREWIGTTEGDVNAEIRPKVDGYLLRRTYTEGSVVRQGQLLFEIDARQAQASLRQAQANLAQAEASLAKATRDVQRYEPLAAQHAISQQELDNARSSREAASASAGALRAAVEQARLNTSWTHVTSPINGIAGIAQTQVGNLVSPQTVLAIVSKVDPIRVTFPMSEQEYLQFQNNPAMRNAELELLLSDGSVHPHKGRITVSGRDVNVKTGTIAVVGLFPNPGNVLRPGQFAKVRAVTDIRRAAVIIPQRAVNELQGVYQVAVVGADNKAQVRPVKLGARVGSSWIVEQGVSAGEQVVVEGFSRVKSGQPVIPKPAPVAAEAK
ncbi:MAG TPA: efflux RND transporter periplasmic adaptor subunit [Thermoanaerobaculia bacterium]|jgi:membrane fusion protein (multidrug efflux system)|nr:efflux RND transporter periplasmic adaptor subunit [Thermoanaerobaculia bacterium]